MDSAGNFIVMREAALDPVMQSQIVSAFDSISTVQRFNGIVVWDTLDHEAYYYPAERKWVVIQE